MASGMQVFGENAFGYRVPAAVAGMATLILTYLISKKLFKDEMLAVVAGLSLSLDGLVLVMSRIGMNDIYFFLGKKNFWAAVFWGLSLSSKWSALWTIPILGMIWILYERNFKWSYLWFLLLPPLIYLGSYFQMFLTGHNLTIFWGMQKQMWWYHTNLKATHNYSSLWYTWPFDIRPVWMFVEYMSGDKIRNIYALGNPVFFWFGLGSVFFTIYYQIRTRINKELGLMVFSYFIYFVPWALSPRIMFFYHYLPSLPFLAIITGFVLRKYPKLILPYFGLSLMAFIYFYPHWMGILVPRWFDNSYYMITSWK